MSTRTIFILAIAFALIGAYFDSRSYYGEKRLLEYRPYATVCYAIGIVMGIGSGIKFINAQDKSL